MIKLPELESKFKVDDGGNTTRDLRLTRLEEAFKSAVSESELKELEGSILNLQLYHTQLEKRILKLEQPKSDLKVEVPEVKSASWREVLIKILSK